MSCAERARDRRASRSRDPTRPGPRAPGRGPSRARESRPRAPGDTHASRSRLTLGPSVSLFFRFFAPRANRFFAPLRSAPNSPTSYFALPAGGRAAPRAGREDHPPRLSVGGGVAAARSPSLSDFFVLSGDISAVSHYISLYPCIPPYPDTQATRGTQKPNFPARCAARTGIRISQQRKFFACCFAIERPARALLSHDACATATNERTLRRRAATSARRHTDTETPRQYLCDQRRAAI